MNARVQHLIDIVGRLENSAIDEALSIIDDYRQTVINIILDSNGITTFDVQRMKNSLDAVADIYDRKLKDLLSENQRRRFVKGIQITDEAIRTLNLTRAIPYLTETTLNSAQTYGAELITNLVSDTRQQINRQLTMGLIGQASSHDVVKKIASQVSPSVFGTSRRRAELIWRTETNRIQSLAEIQRIKQWAIEYPDMRKQWLHSHMGIPRPSHIALDKSIIPVNDSFHLSDKNGTYEVYAPYDPVLPASHTVNCRCMVVPII